MTTTTFSMPALEPLPSFTPVSPTSSSASTTIFPLTTIFTPNPACTNTITFFSSDGLYFSSTGLYAGFISALDFSTYPSACFPTAISDVYDNFNVSAYYSPGVCPSGYNQVTSTFASSATASFKKGETAALCCPRSYAFIDNNIEWEGKNFCASSFPRGMGSMRVFSVTVDTSSAKATDWTTYTTLLIPHIVTAAAIQVRWRANDSLPTAPGPESTLDTSSALYGIWSPISVRVGVNSPQSIIAISVVVPIITLCLIISLIFWFLRRRRQKQEVDINASIFDLPEVVEKGNPNTSVEYTRVGFFNKNEKTVVHPPTLVQSYRPSTDQVRTAQRQPEDGKEVIEEMSASPIPQPASLQVATPESEGLMPVEEAPSVHSQPATPSQSPDRSTLETELRQIREEREQRELELLRRKEQTLMEELARQDA